MPESPDLAALRELAERMERGDSEYPQEWGTECKPRDVLAALARIETLEEYVKLLAPLVQHQRIHWPSGPTFDPYRDCPATISPDAPCECGLDDLLERVAREMSR